MKTDLYFIGIDGGGTKCRARLEDASGALLGEGVSGPANIMRDCTLAISSMLDAVSKAIAQSSKPIKLQQCVVGAGLAGANVSKAKQTCEAWEHPFASFYLLSDLHAACIGAHNGEEGAALIIGTGSSGTHWKDGVFHDVGGHGFPVGDIASGAWLGLKAVQHTLLCFDGLAPADRLFDAIRDQLNAEKAEDVVSACATFNTHHYASLVEAMLPLFYTNEESVVAFFQEGAEYIEHVATRLLSDNNAPLAMIGGLSDIYASTFSSQIKARLVSCQASPQQGALFFAKSTHSQSKGVK